MKKLFYIPVLCLVLLSSCATIFSGSKARITVADDKVTTPVTLTVDGNKYPNTLLPAKIKVKRGFKSSTLTAEANGYETSTINIDKKFNGTTLWNIILGGIPGMAIDAATGAMMKPESKYYVLNLQPETRKEYVTLIAPVQSEPKETVTRDDAGQTDLERTIIRWYFDSDPRGARIYWRVISSIPAEVKNTNETYLMTTPFEETRAFNILGLTYENSHDVQIEIKVSKRGYEDQIKRFNVRQAIDQQEISAFFELVEKPDAE